MENVKVSKEKLLEILKSNRQQHRKIFEEVCEGYKKKAIELLEEKLAIAKKGEKVKMMFALQEPSDQTKDYDRAIRMMEMSLTDQITLSEEDFQQYVMDDWSWKRQFLSNNSAYSVTANTALLAE